MAPTTGHHVKEISENPSKNAVTSPTDPAYKAVDTDRKLKLYGVIQAFREGKTPNNRQCLETLDYVIDHSPIDERKLSKDGRTLVEDSRDIIRTLRTIVAEKNDDEAIQNFIYHTRKTSTPSASDIKNVSTGTDQQQMQQDGQQAVEHLRTLGKLIFTNSEARKLLKDIGILGRDIAADGAAKVAEVARPDEDQLRQIDEPAPSNQWVGPNGEKRDHNSSVPDTGLQEKKEQLQEAREKKDSLKQELKDDVKSRGENVANSADQAQQSQAGPATGHIGSARDAAGVAANTAQQHGAGGNYGSTGQAFGSTDPTYGSTGLVGADAHHNGQPPYFGGVPAGGAGSTLTTQPGQTLSTSQGGFASAQGGNFGSAQAGNFSSTGGFDQQQQDEARARAQAGKDAGVDQAKDEAKGLKNKLLAKVPDEHKDRADEQVQKTKDYLHEKLPQERIDRFTYRLKKVIVECQRHQDYQAAIDFFLDKAEHYQVQAKSATQQSGGTVASIRHDDNFQSATSELRSILERFANGESMQPIFDSVDQLYTDAKNDDGLRQWFRELDHYIRLCLQEPGYIMKDEADRRGRELRESGKHYWDPKNGKYSGHKDNFFNSVQNFFTSYADDGLNQRLGESVKSLVTDLFLNSEGNITWKPELWTDIRKVILPTLFQQIGYVPIPRAEYSSRDVDLVVENLTLETANLLPNIFEIEARNYFKLSQYDQLGDVSKHSFWVSFSQVQCDLKDVAFYIKKKTGFPKLTDSGYADVFLGGKGLSGKVHLESTGRKHHAFKVVNVDIKIDKLKFAVRDSKHATLINFLRPLATGLIKSAISKALEAAIRSGLEQVDMQLSDLSERLEDAKHQEGTSKIDALKQSFNTKKNEAERKKEKAQEMAPDGKFSLTLDPKDKIVNWEAPDSTLAKMEVQKENARKTGNVGWESPAFTLVGDHAVGAKSTSNSHGHGASTQPAAAYKA
ncbi:hypothetical protein JCM10908_004313 [Rhodotorula pacifica]|uniref:uncharacterized protein n=1 Tax=Rhodotorula pacifica TaxID=1495444 RepID=UPI003178C8F2